MPVTINPDGVSVKGCSIIYAPKGQAGEYAQLACNPYIGCTHQCLYCWVPIVKHMDRQTFYRNVVSRPNFLALLRKDAAKYQVAGITGQVLCSFTCDLYNPTNRELSRPTLEILIEHGLAFSVLTKGGMRAVADLDLFRPDRDCFAATLTSLDAHFSNRWEPGAAPPASRIAALRKFHEAGMFTWVSLEPTLDAAASIEIVKATHGFVDLFKVGRANYLKGYGERIDWADYTARMIEVLNQLGARHYIKHDLQGFLPANYPNPLRVQQHH